MPRYFLHLIDGEDRILDPDGVVMNPDAVERAVLTSARDCIAADVLTGVINFRFRIEAHDEAGRAVHVLPFRDAVRIVTSD